MKLCIKNFDGRPAAVSRRLSLRAFTIVEAVVVMGLLLILIVAVIGSICTMQVSASRVADYTAGMAIVEAKIMDIRALYYNPPNGVFNNSTFMTNQTATIDLNQAGTTFLITGQVTTTIVPEGTMGHLVTVSATFNAPMLPMTVKLQTLVNKYSGGEQ